MPDIDDGVLGKVWLVTDDAYMNNVYDCTVNFSVNERIKEDQYNNDYFYTTLTVDSQRTNKWISDNYGLTLSTMGESSEIQYSNSDASVYAKNAAVAIG